MLKIIPTRTDSQHYIQTTTLDGADFIFKFTFNSYSGFWYFDLFDAEGVLLVGRDRKSVV